MYHSRAYLKFWNSPIQSKHGFVDVSYLIQKEVQCNKDIPATKSCSPFRRTRIDSRLVCCLGGQVDLAETDENGNETNAETKTKTKTEKVVKTRVRFVV